MGLKNDLLRALRSQSTGGRGYGQSSRGRGGYVSAGRSGGLGGMLGGLLSGGNARAGRGARFGTGTAYGRPSVNARRSGGRDMLMREGMRLLQRQLGRRR